MGFFTINKRLLPIKFHYALSSGMVTVQPAMPVYTKVLRFSTFVVGTIYTILPVLGIFMKPLFATIADKYKCHRAVLIVWEIITLMSYFLIQFIPPPVPPSSINATQISEFHVITNLSACSSNNVLPYFLVGTNTHAWSCNMTNRMCEELDVGPYCAPYRDSFEMVTCLSIPLNKGMTLNISDCTPETPLAIQFANETNNDASMSDEDTFSTWQFWVFLALLIGTSGGTVVVGTLTDTICYEICGDAFGPQRMWASLYWGVVAIINGFIIDAVSTEGQSKNYTPAFYLMLVPLVIDVFITYNLKFDIPARSENIVKDVGTIVIKPRNALFLFWCVMAGISFGLLGNFLFWLLEELADSNNQMSQIKTIEGFVTGIQALLGSTPSFYFGGYIIKQIGYGHSMSIVLLFLGIRFTLYSFLANPWWCLPIELLHNDNGLFYSTMTSYAKKVSLPGTEATIQSVYCVACEGVGVAIGSFLAGVLYDIYGGAMTFRIFGVCYLVMSVVNEFIEMFYRIVKLKSKAKIAAIS